MMNKRIVLILVIGILVFSCQKVEKPPKPEHFLTKEKMLPILIDIAIVKSGKDFDLKKIREKGITPSDFVYKKNGIDSTIYQENNAWYAAHPKLYEELFTMVKDTLTVIKLQLEKQIAEQDSLKNSTDSIAIGQGEKTPIGMRNRAMQKSQKYQKINNTYLKSVKVKKPKSKK